MYKNRILVILCLLVILSPSIAFASWWNPGTWFNKWSFSSKNTVDIDLLENDKMELGTELSNTTNNTELSVSQPEQVFTTTTIKIQEKNSVEVKKVPAKQSVETKPNIIPSIKTIDYEKYYLDITGKFSELRLNIRKERDGLINNNVELSGIQKSYKTFLIDNLEILNKYINILDDIKDVVPKPQNKINEYALKYDEIKSTFDLKRNEYNARVLREKESLIKDEESKRTNQELSKTIKCKKSKKEIYDIQNNIEDIKDKYRLLVTEFNQNKQGMYGQGFTSELTELSRKEKEEINLLNSNLTRAYNDNNYYCDN